MRVLFTCGREPEYPRNATWLACLQQNFKVFPVTDSHPWWVVRYSRLTMRLLATRHRYDLAFIGFLGQPLVLWMHLLTRKPILFDAFLSVYDTLCFDRQQFAPTSVAGRIAFWLDYISCKLADLVVLDTRSHADYFHKTFQVPDSKLRVLFVGADETLFYPRPSPDMRSHLVLFYGSFLPLHGVDIIIRAAKLLESYPGIHFRLIGNGPEYPSVRQLAHQLDIQNVEFHPPVRLKELPEEIARATVCLGGHFGTTEKAKRVIASKTFQCLAMGKATIVGDNSANRELLTPGHDAWFCPMGDPEALAEAILVLINDPDLRTHLGHNARQTFLNKASIAVLSQQVRQMVEEAAMLTGRKIK